MTQVNRGLPTPRPMSTPRGSGIADLTKTVKPSGKAIPNALAADKGLIAGMQRAGEEAVEQGAEGLPPDPGTQPGSHRSNIPGGVGNLIAPQSWNVP